MIKTIALAALGTFIAAAPALAGPGLVLQGRSLDGIKYQTTADTLALHAAPQRAPLPTMPATAMAIDAELVGAPVQIACGNNCGGIKFNGIKLNGLKWNGLKWNGFQLNGVQFNGVESNGRFLNGRFLNGWSLNGVKLNGLNLNGITWNGRASNGRFLNGAKLNGRFLNGRNFNGEFLNGKLFKGRLLNGTDLGAVTELADDGFFVTAVTLPGGERLTIAN